MFFYNAALQGMDSGAGPTITAGAEVLPLADKFVKLLPNITRLTARKKNQ